jgi:hypothetical protein
MTDNDVLLEDLSESSAIKQAALSYVTEAFAEAELDGLDSDYMAQARSLRPLRSLSKFYGEEQSPNMPKACPNASAAAASHRVEALARRSGGSPPASLESVF